MKSETFKMAFNILITETYLKYKQGEILDVQPEGVKNSKTEWVGENADNLVVDKFLEDFEITDDVNDHTVIADIENWLKCKEQNISMKKFAIDFTKYCKIKGHNKVENSVKKISGKSKRVWVGVKVNREEAASVL